MSFDDRIRDSLSAAAAAHDPGAAPIEQLAANVRRRQRAKLARAGVGAIVAVVLLIGLVAVLPDRASPRDTVNAAGDGAGPVTNEREGAGGSPSKDGAADSSTTTTHDTITAHTGVAAPPATIVGQPPTTSTTGTVSTTTQPATGDTVNVTQDDDGKTFTLRPGQHLVVTLDDSAWQWSDPDTDNAKVLARTAVSANPSATHVTASFDAKSAGQAHVSASKDAPCRKAQPPCMTPTYLWQVTINVATT
jgi:hypothetical protein